MTYNSAPLVKGVFRRLPKGVFDSVIIVDDGSKDAIREIAAELDVPFFTHEHLGYGGNIKYGLRKAMEMGADYMVEIHGDGQYDISASVPGIEKIKRGYDFVLGSRFIDKKQTLRDKMPLSKYFANIGLSFISKLILQTPLTEYHCGFRIYSRKLVTTASLDNASDDFLFGFEVIAQAAYHGLRIAEVPVRCFYGHEHSSMGFSSSVIYAFQNILVLLRYAWARLGFPSKLFKGQVGVV